MSSRSSQNGQEDSSERTPSSSGRPMCGWASASRRINSHLASMICAELVPRRNSFHSSPCSAESIMSILKASTGQLLVANPVLAQDPWTRNGSFLCGANAPRRKSPSSSSSGEVRGRRSRGARSWAAHGMSFRTRRPSPWSARRLPHAPSLCRTTRSCPIRDASRLIRRAIGTGYVPRPATCAEHGGEARPQVRISAALPFLDLPPRRSYNRIV